MSAVAQDGHPDRHPDEHQALSRDRMTRTTYAAAWRVESPIVRRGVVAPEPMALKNTRPSKDIVAFKFGGSSLLGADRMLHSAQLVGEAAATRNISHDVEHDAAGNFARKVVIIVSAMKGLTDRLLAVARTLEAGCRTDARRDAENILHTHWQVLRDLQLEAPVHERLERELRLLGEDLLQDASPEKQPCPATGPALQDRLASYGERFSAKLFCGALEKLGVRAVAVDSSDFVLTCDTFRDARPHLEETRRRGREVLLPLFADGLVPVVTGFIGATSDGRVTTLGRNSADFSGALVAHVVDAGELVIWTDVDGIYTDNPRESAEAQLLHELSYDEAHALAAAGAKVLHAKVLPLAAESEMVVWVRNTFNPQFRGTRIGPVPDQMAEVRGRTSVPSGVLPANEQPGYACELFDSRGAE
jgi:aspartokinase/homoserine dehydrogenase 1